MFWSSELNRHVIGAAAVAAAIFGVAIWGGSWTTNQRSRFASLENPAQMTGSRVERQPLTQTAREFGGMTEHRSAASNQAQERTQAMPEPPSGSKAGALGTAASAWKNWSNEDWQIAIQAVREHRSAASTPSGTDAGATQPNEPGADSQAGRASSELQWKAPEEISGKGGGAPR